MAKRLVCRVQDVADRELRECETEDGMKLVVANAGGEFFGFQAACPHQDVPLCEGIFDGATLTCHMLKVLESDPASGYVVMRGLAELIARYLAADAPRS